MTVRAKDVWHAGRPGGEGAAVSSRAGRLTLPAIHDRETARLVDLITATDLPAHALRDYARSHRPVFVFATIQSAARRLGEKWVRDGVDFADLTVCLSRLHDLLRLVPDPPRGVDAGLSFAILLQPFDDHILGGAVLEARLRHAGFATEFFPDWSDQDLSHFDAVLICVTNTDRSAELSDRIARVRARMSAIAPVIVGGPGSNASRGTGAADLVTSSLIEAVGFCEARTADTPS